MLYIIIYYVYRYDVYTSSVLFSVRHRIIREPQRAGDSCAHYTHTHTPCSIILSLLWPEETNYFIAGEKYSLWYFRDDSADALQQRNRLYGLINYTILYFTPAIVHTIVLDVLYFSVFLL